MTLSEFLSKYNLQLNIGINKLTARSCDKYYATINQDKTDDNNQWFVVKDTYEHSPSGLGNTINDAINDLCDLLSNKTIRKNIKMPNIENDIKSVQTELTKLAHKKIIEQQIVETLSKDADFSIPKELAEKWVSLVASNLVDNLRIIY
jgi:hypothetical protein